MTIRRLALAVPILLAAWIGTLALVMRVGAEAPAAFVPFPPDRFLDALPQDITVTSRSNVSLTLRSDAPDLTARLYTAGAWLVLPAGLEACIPNFLREPTV